MQYTRCPECGSRNIDFEEKGKRIFYFCKDCGFRPKRGMDFVNVDDGSADDEQFNGHTFWWILNRSPEELWDKYPIVLLGILIIVADIATVFIVKEAFLGFLMILSVGTGVVVFGITHPVKHT